MCLSYLHIIMIGLVTSACIVQLAKAEGSLTLYESSHMFFALYMLTAAFQSPPSTKWCSAWRCWDSDSSS